MIDKKKKKSLSTLFLPITPISLYVYLHSVSLCNMHFSVYNSMARPEEKNVNYEISCNALLDFNNEQILMVIVLLLV